MYTATDTHVIRKGAGRRPASELKCDDNSLNRITREGSDRYTDTDTYLIKKVRPKASSNKDKRSMR